MLKKTIEYEDYNGVTRKEDFYFNLSKAEIMEMEMTMKDGLNETIRNIIKAKDVPAIVNIFKELVLKSYGEKSTDGKRFLKSEEIKNNFACTEAYSTLFMELATNEEKAAEFVNGILPKDLTKQIDKNSIQENLKELGIDTIENK